MTTSPPSVPGPTSEAEELAKMGTVVREDPTQRLVAPYSGNLVKGVSLAASQVADELTTDPGGFWDRHWGNHDKHVADRLKVSRSEPVVGFVKNAGRGLIDIVTFAPQVFFALSEASSESPEEVAKLVEGMAGGIVAGTAHMAANPLDNLEADPFGTAATALGITSAAKAKAPALLARARKHMAPSQVAKFDRFVEDSTAAFNAVKDAPIRVGSLRTESKAKTVRKRTLDDDFGITGGTKPLTVGEIVSGGVKAGALGFFAGGGITPGALTLGAYLVGKTGAGALRAHKGPLANKTIGAMDRFIKTVAGAGDMGSEAATSAILSEAARADGALGSELRNIHQLILSGKTTEAGARLDGLSGNKGVIESVIQANISHGKTGRAVDQVVSSRKQNSRQYDRLDPELAEAVNSALKVVDDVLGADNVTPATRQRITAIANLDSLVFGGLEPLRHKLVKRLSERMGRPLTRDEKNLIHMRSEQFAAVGHVAGKGLGGRITLKGADGKPGASINLRTEYDNILKGMPSKERDSIIGAVVVDTIAQHRAGLRSKAFSSAIDRDAHRILSKRTRAMLREDPKARTFTGGQRAINQAYTDDLVRAVVGMGDATPMSAPSGINMKAISNILLQDPPAFAARALGSLSSDAAKMKQATFRVESLARELADSKAFRNRRETSESREALLAARKTQGMLDDLAADGVNIGGIKEKLKVLEDIEAASALTADVSMRAPLVETLGWLDGATMDANAFARVMNTARGAVKTGLTAMTVGVHIGNDLANVLFTASDRGHSVFRVVRDDVETAARLYSHAKGKRKNLTKEDQRIFSMISDMGFKMGDVTAVEMANFLRRSDRVLGGTMQRHAGRLKSVIGESAPAKAVRAYAERTKEVYSWGDTVPKANEAYHSIRFLEKTIIDLAPGRHLDVQTHRGLFRRLDRGADGKLMIDGKAATPKQVRDITMGYARRRANERFKDFRARPGFLRTLDATGLGALMNPFITWRAKAMGIGDPGMGTILAKASKGVRTNDPKILASMYMDNARIQARRAMMLQAAKQYSDDNRELFGKMAGEFGEALGLLSITESERPGNVNIRNFLGISSVVPQVDLAIAGAQLVANLFYDDDKNQVRRAAKGYGSDQNVWEAVIENAKVLGWDGGMLEQLNNMMSSESTPYERKRAVEFFGRGLAGGTMYDVGSFLLEAAERYGLPVQTDNYYDYLRKHVPKNKQRDIAEDLLNRLAGPLGSRDVSALVNAGGDAKHVWHKQFYARDLLDMRKNIHRNFWLPVAKKYGPNSEEANEAFQLAKGWFSQKLRRIHAGYRKVFNGENPPMGQRLATQMDEGTLIGWKNSFKKDLR